MAAWSVGQKPCASMARSWFMAHNIHLVGVFSVRPGRTAMSTWDYLLNLLVCRDARAGQWRVLAPAGSTTYANPKP